MAFNKVIVSFALVAICAVVTEAATANSGPDVPGFGVPAQQQGPVPAPVPTPGAISGISPNGVPQNVHPRDKKFALYSSAYSYSYPSYYSYPSAIPAVSYYSYQKAYPYAYNSAYYPTYYSSYVI